MPDPALTHLHLPPRRETGDKPPLLVLLHGVGSNEQDLFSLAGELDPRFAVVSARAPFTRFPGSYAWFDVEMLPGGEFRIDPGMWEESRGQLEAFITEAVAHYDADPGRVHLVGFSQGAIMSLSIMLTNPSLVAGVAAMSGRLLPEVRPLVRPGAELAGFPVLVVHGTEDAVIPVRYGREVNEFLQTLPVELAYQEFPMGHQVSAASLELVSTWLTAHLDRSRG